MQVPAALILALNGLVVVFVVGSIRGRQWLSQWAAQLRRDSEEAAGELEASEKDALPGDEAPQ